ncbi:MAG: sugar phosphate nucleotidyltransferase [Pseudomonadota bacterium]
MNNAINEFDQVPVVILCGGKGVMLDERQNHRVNKGLIQIEDKPLFWWVIRHYALHGATDFVLATGFQSEQFIIALEVAGATRHVGSPGCYDVKIAKTACRVRVVPTLKEATTAERLLACKPWLEQAEQFAVTYSDTLSDVDLSDEMRFHKSQGLVATLIATKLPVRFRILGIRTGEAAVRAFASRPVIETANINGGYYIFTKSLWAEAYGLAKLLSLENQPLERLAAAGQLTSFAHNGHWQTCDAERDITELCKLARQLDSLNRNAT